MCRILASRISDLEEAAQSGQVAAFPSQLLLEGYASSEVDRDVGHIVSAERPDGSDSEGECITSIHLDTQCESIVCGTNEWCFKSVMIYRILFGNLSEMQPCGTQQRR